jgi:hypothetical protein
MKTVFNLSAVAVFLVVAPGVCFALWDVVTLSKDQAKELGMEVRVKAAGPKHVQVVLEFNPEDKLKGFTQVDLEFDQGDKPTLSAALREDRSKPGRVVVGFTASTAELDRFTLSMSVPYRDGGLGGTTYQLRVKDFVELKKDR